MTLKGSRAMQDKEGELLLRILVYEQKEIAWGSYQIDGKGDGIIDILPYSQNLFDKANPPHSKYYDGNKTYYLYLMNHTHPSFWGRAISGEFFMEYKKEELVTLIDEMF